MRSSFMLTLSLTMLSFLTRLGPTLANVNRVNRARLCEASDPHCGQRLSTRVGTARMTSSESQTRTAKNVLGGTLELCCNSPKTGFYRDGYCHTGPTDHGVHTVCAVVTDEFLEYSRSRGNDLMTAAPEFGFPGLKSGDKWCLCVSRWKEALDVGKAPGVVLGATHVKALEVVSIEELRAHAVDG